MTEHILSLSYGKDSMACLGAIEKLGLPLDRIVTAEVWATDTIHADLPPMVEFKSYADKVIKERWGIEVEHYYATNKDGSKKTYEQEFYRICPPRRKDQRKTDYINSKYYQERPIYGSPLQMGAWCNSRLKVSALQRASSHYRGFSQIKGNWCTSLKTKALTSDAQEYNAVQYIGIAEDEPERLARLDGVTKISPLHLIGWTEADAKQWCIDNDLLSPIYTTASRGGCWFCHNQGVGQLRLLRRNYPELWAMLMKWDLDSPVTFKADGHTVHDFDRRFALEDDGYISEYDKVFRWSYLDNPPPRQIDIFGNSKSLNELE